MTGQTITHREAGKKWTLPAVLSFGNAVDLKLAFYKVLGFREPRAGEYYLSGGPVEAWKTTNDLSTKYLVVKPTHKAVKSLAYQKGDPL